MSSNLNNNKINNNKSQDAKLPDGLKLPVSKQQKVTAMASGQHCHDLLKKKVLKLLYYTSFYSFLLYFCIEL